jgi:hypothetical protein
MSQTKDHIHKYIRVSPNIYMCADPDCMYRTNKLFLKGKRSICAEDGCETEIILNPEALRRAKPKCLLHQDTAESKTAKQRMEILKGMGVDI